MSKIIKFLAQDDHVWNVRPKPYPAAKGIPDWYKNIPMYTDNKKGFDLSPRSSVTVKRCVPILDMLTSGYYVPLWADLLVKQEEEKTMIKWATSTSVLDIWSPLQVDQFDIPDGFSKNVFKNLHGWTIKTPPGWSCLFIHPVAYSNTPFRTIPGIVDTDILDTEINVPFVIKEGFEGILEKGTPMFQVIPFKREKWNSEFELKIEKQHFFDIEKFYSKINRSYYSLIQDKKTYR